MPTKPRPDVAGFSAHTKGPARWQRIGGAVRLVAARDMRPILIDPHAEIIGDPCEECGRTPHGPAHLRCFDRGLLSPIDPGDLTLDMRLIELAFDDQCGLVASWQRIAELEAENKSLRQTVSGIALAMCATVERHQEELRAAVTETEAQHRIGILQRWLALIEVTATADIPPSQRLSSIAQYARDAQDVYAGEPVIFLFDKDLESEAQDA